VFYFVFTQLVLTCGLEALVLTHKSLREMKKHNNILDIKKQLGVLECNKQKYKRLNVYLWPAGGPWNLPRSQLQHMNCRLKTLFIFVAYFTVHSVFILHIVDG
jgi:hypothetical protein